MKSYPQGVSRRKSILGKLKAQSRSEGTSMVFVYQQMLVCGIQEGKVIGLFLREEMSSSASGVDFKDYLI